MAKKLTVANLIMLIGGGVTLLFSFLPFYDFGSESRSAWSQDAGAFVSTIPALLALAMIVWIVVELVGSKLPDKVLTYSSDQLKGIWGIAAAGLMLAWLTTDTQGDKGIGFWFMLLGSLAMAVGAVLALLGMANQVVGAGSGGAGAADGAPPPPPGLGTPPSPPAGGSPPPPPPV